MSTLLVEPRNGSWVVRRDGCGAPISEHTDAAAATRAARAQNEAAQIVIRDRYHRTHALRAPTARRRSLRG
jgi:hypothetical protein